jgi:hypothetical protein
MSQITTKICAAFEERRELKIDNSNTDGESLWLFGNKIAKWVDGEIWITNAGWSSKTTKDRLNGLSRVSIRQASGSWYLNGNYWEGEWTKVSDNNREATTPLEVAEFDLTSKWIASGKYSKPIYSVAHKYNVADLFACECLLNASGIKHRTIEADTDGEYMPNYFLVVMPEDYDLSLTIIN